MGAPNPLSATSFLARLGLSYPIVQAPMAGGFTPPGLVAAVSRAGALGSLGCAYMTAEAIGWAAGEVRSGTDRPFSINLFAHPEPPPDDVALESALFAFAPIRLAAGLAERPPLAPRIPLKEQIEAVLDSHPALFSTTFGAPDADTIAACRARGILVASTATTVEEGVALEALGVDAVIAQGSEAGGHRGTFLGDWRHALIGTLPLVSMLAARLRCPVIAAGGIMNGKAIRAVLEAGAAAAALGTAFLLCPEAGTPAPHRRLLQDPNPRPTVVSAVYTGRAARGIENTFAREMATLEGKTPPFDTMNALTRDLRKASADRGDPEWMSLWAGQGYPLARALPAAELVRTLADEAGLGAS